MIDLNIGHKWSILISLQLTFPNARPFLGSGSGLNIILGRFDFYPLIIVVRVVVFLVFFFSIVTSLLCFVVYSCVLRLGPLMFQLFIY